MPQPISRRGMEGIRGFFEADSRALDGVDFLLEGKNKSYLMPGRSCDKKLGADLFTSISANSLPFFLFIQQPLLGRPCNFEG